MFAVEERELAHHLAVSHTTVTHVSVVTGRLTVGEHTGQGEVAASGRGPTRTPVSWHTQACAVVASLDGADYSVADVAEALAGTPTARLLAEMVLLDALSLRAGVRWGALEPPRPSRSACGARCRGATRCPSGAG